MVDYLWSAAVPLLPRVMGWNGPGAQVFTAAGLGTLAYSLCTDYELGLVPSLSMRTHLVVDVANAVALGTAPLWLDDEPEVKVTLAGLGLLALGIVLATDPDAGRR